MNKQLYYYSKRTFDVVAASTALVVLSPVLAITAIIIKLESKGPIVYKSKRVGQHYKTFDLFKFRSMTTGADQNTDLMKKLNAYETTRTKDIEASDDCPFCKMLGRQCSPLLVSDNGSICENFYFLKKEKGDTFFKIKNDPRVTTFGKFIRKSSIDELPQLFNIIKGDMSLIGNRPLPLYEAEKLTSDYAVQRFNAPAGLTGLWQIKQRGRVGINANDRINLDNEYAQTWSLKTDLMIFFKTFPALIQQENV